MNREYHKWYSPNLQRDMELLIFGHSGARVLFFPTRGARFYDYENWKVIEAIRDKIEMGILQIYCVDSIDHESFYCQECHPKDKIKRHFQYEKYIIEEVILFSFLKNSQPFIISSGCSLGAYHAINIAFKYPQHFGKVVGMSGRYDLTMQVGVFEDLFKGYRDQNIYNNSPNQYIPDITDKSNLDLLKSMEILLVIGEHDAFLENNKHLSMVLNEQGITNSLYVWEEEAHKPWYWGKMLELYL